MTFEWLISYLEVYGNSVNLLVMVVREGDGIVGLAPLMINDARELVFIGYPQNDYADLIIADDAHGVLEEIWKTMIAHRNRYKKIILDQMQEEMSHWKESCELLDRMGKPYRLLLSDTCPAMELDDIEAARSKYYKRNITTYVNWYEKQGNFSFNTPQERGEALARLEDLFAQHIERRDKTPFPSQFVNPSTCEFYRKFVGRLFDRGWMLVATMTLDKEFLALYLAMPYQNRLYLYTTSFNDNYSKRSPGQVILRFLFDYAVDKGYRWLDFARGDEGYKDRFANCMYQNRKIIVYNSALTKKAADLFHAARYSSLADRLYRNRRVQGSLMTFKYFKRKEGLVSAVSKTMPVLFAREKQARQDKQDQKEKKANQGG